MDHLVLELQQAVSDWDRRAWPRPQAMVVAGSGLAMDLGKSLIGRAPLGDLLPFPISGIAGHSLEFELVEPIPGRVVLSARGRIHGYQGHTPAQTVFLIRLAALLGIKVLMLTNSSGGIRPDLRPGDLVVVDDHLNLTGGNPLWGQFPTSWGPQFPDMMQAYNPELRALLSLSADQLGIKISKGVYAGLGGPSYETPAEVRMLGRLGADLVGMSTVLEIIAAHHMGVRCACVSVVSNAAAGVTDEILDHADVLARGKDSAVRLAALLGHFLRLSQLI